MPLTGQLAVPEPVRLLAQADIGVSPYCGRVEYSGLKLLDYKAAGLAIIASGGNNQPSVLEHRRTGWIVPPCDEMDLANVIIALAENPRLRSELGQAPGIEAESMHSWRRTVGQLIGAFNSVKSNKVADPSERYGRGAHIQDAQVMEHSNETTRLRIGYLMQKGVVELSEISGARLHVLAVIQGLRQLGHSVELVAFQHDKLGWSEDLEHWFPPEYGITGSKLLLIMESAIRRIQYELKLPFLGIFDSLHYADACKNQFQGFDLLYERHGYMGFGGLIAAQRLGIPLILELNGNILKEIDERRLGIPPFQRHVGRWTTVQTLRAADRVIVVSEALRQILINDYHIPREKVSVVLNGVDLDLFSRTYDADLVRSRYRLPSAPIIAFVGTFEPWHGVDLLISSFHEVTRKHPEAQLVLIGDGAGQRKARDHACDYGLADRISFLGRLAHEEVAAVLKIAKVLVAPYPFEHSDIVGTPLKLLEYMATGNGIVASTAPIHEIIEDGKTGLRVPPANKEALAQGIICLLENDALCSYLGQNAALHAQMHSWDSVVGQLERILVDEIAKKMRRDK